MENIKAVLFTTDILTRTRMIINPRSTYIFDIFVSQHYNCHRLFWFVLGYLYSFLLHWTKIKLTNDNVLIYKPRFTLFWRTKEITFKVWLCVSIDPFPNKMEIAMIRMLFWISQSHKQQNTEMLLKRVRHCCHLLSLHKLLCMFALFRCNTKTVLNLLMW